MATNENLIPIPGRLHSVATEGHVAGADEIYDDTLQKDQATINGEVNAALGEGGTVDEKIAEAIDDALEDVAFIDDSESSPAVVPGFDPTTDTVHVTAQTLSEQQKAQVRTNIGLGDVDAKINQAVASEASQRAAAVSGVQSSVNAEASRAQAAEADRYTKSETYTKTEVNGLVDTPHQEYVTVDTYASLPETGSKDTIYRVSNYNGSTSQVDASVYSEYAWNGSQYIFLCVKSQIGEVFDISVYNNNAKYADLAAALNGGANIPQSLQKGGMSVKFVQSSDNKYVQYRLRAQTFTTNVSEWEDESSIVDGSEQTEAELSFVDDDDNCIAQFKGGHVKTKEFDTRESATKNYVNNKVSTELSAAKGEILAKVAEVDNLENNDEEVAIIDENDNCIALFKEGHIQTKYFNSRSVLSYKGRGTVLTDFTDFSGSGGIVSADKKSISISAEGAIIKHSNQHLNAWNFNISACIIPVGTTFSVGIGKYIDLDATYYPNSSLFALEFDGETSKIVTYKPDSSGVITKVVETALQTISFASGKKYWMLVQKKTTERSLFDVTITDEYGNSETITNIYCGTGMSLSGYGWGAPCVFMLDGESVTISDFSFGFPVSSELRCLMLGHSWVEANTQATEHQNSFAGLIQTALGGSDYCLNLGRGGFDADVLKVLTDTIVSNYANAKYALIGIGLNDLKAYINTDTFGEKEVELEQNLAIIQAKLVSAGIIPIFLSLAWTCSTGKPTVDGINPWMKSNLLNVVDINKVFEDNSGNLIESAFVADGQHPTVESCEKIFNCIKAQASFLFNQ